MKIGQYFALVTGIALIAMGVMGFIPTFLANSEAYEGYSYILGFVPTNYLFNFVRIAIGLFGLLASLSLASSRIYGRFLAISYALLAIMGLIPYADTTFGLMPIFGANVWIHAIIGAIGFYFGFIAQPGLLKLSTSPDVEVQDYINLPSQKM